MTKLQTVEGGNFFETQCRWNYTEERPRKVWWDAVKQNMKSFVQFEEDAPSRTSGEIKSKRQLTQLIPFHTENGC